ncbi:MAG: carbonic anhydrase family protein [Burkholderiaceae bacterium]
MKRTLIEVVLALALIGAAVFGWLNWQANLKSTSQLKTLQTASEEAAKSLATSDATAKAAEEQISALRQQMAPMQSQLQELTAVKAGLSSGASLSDLQAAYKSQKNLSAERQVGLASLLLLTKGSNDPATQEAFRKAIQLSELGNRKNTICAAQLGLVAGGEKVALLAECQPQSASGEAKELNPKPVEKADSHAKTQAHDSAGKKSDKHAAAHWGYDGIMGPERWGKEFPTCAKGKSQSPLDIRGPFVKSRASVSADYKEGPLKIINNGHTIQVNVAPGSKLRIDSIPHDLLQFHFHRPSEEKIEGQPMAMVLHFVHKNAAGKLAVLGVLLKEGNENPGIKTLWTHLPKSEGAEFSPEGISFNPGNLLPREFDFYSYEGSLTTPPCTEDVSFYILRTPINVSQEQVNQFPFKNNARPVQPRNGREILMN